MDNIYIIEMPEVLSSFIVTYKIGKVRKEDISDYLTEVYKLAFQNVYNPEMGLRDNAKLYHKLLKDVVHFVGSLNSSDSRFFGDFIKTTISIIPELSELMAYNNLTIDYKVKLITPTLIKIEKKNKIKEIKWLLILL